MSRSTVTHVSLIELGFGFIHLALTQSQIYAVWSYMVSYLSVTTPLCLAHSCIQILRSSGLMCSCTFSYVNPNSRAFSLFRLNRLQAIEFGKQWSGCDCWKPKEYASKYQFKSSARLKIRVALKLHVRKNYLTACLEISNRKRKVNWKLTLDVLNAHSSKTDTIANLFGAVHLCYDNHRNWHWRILL